MQNFNFYEEKAIEFLKLKGYRILDRNFYSRFGEIDVIAIDKKYIAFIEVKARSVNSMVSGVEAIDIYKKEKIKKVALLYTLKRPNKYFRFDVLEIIQGRNFRQYSLIKDAFRLDEV